ncbi:MAG: hypothetical protein ACRYFZ_10510 [Janthinobacterium lividum]
MHKLVYLLLGAALLHLPAPAQDIGPALDMTLMTGWAGNAAVHYDLEKRAAAAKGGRSSSAPASTASFAYRSSPSTRARAVEQVADRVRPRTPQLAQAITTAFGPGKADFETTYAQIIDGTGLRSANAADAMAAYLLMGYAIVHNLQDDKDITPTLASGVRQQVQGVLTQNPKLKPGDPVAAARLGEELKLQTVVLQAGWQSALKEGKLPTYQQQTAQLFKASYGLDLSALRLTAQGFAKR